MHCQRNLEQSDQTHVTKTNHTKFVSSINYYVFIHIMFLFKPTYLIARNDCFTVIQSKNFLSVVIQEEDIKRISDGSFVKCFNVR
ncbi:hypothetical protein V1477_010548 [Vespula maculifrons]|uniref:Uncharacterized protein n=1 Tax=Vespula maculifrons TaxID=7453 RepID=A0ABD2C2D6_VESMC